MYERACDESEVIPRTIVDLICLSLSQAQDGSM